MERVGTQVRLPLRRAVQIAVQGIRIRFGRSLVTVSGVVLGIAFLMSNITGQFITQAITKQRELRQTVSLMETVVKGEVGNPQGKIMAVAAFGAVSAAEKGLIEKLVKSSPARFQAFGLDMPGLALTDRSRVGDGAALLLVLGNAAACPAQLGELTSGMTQKVVLDSVAHRSYAGEAAPAVRVEPFFGKETEEQIQKMREAAQQARFRTIWIAIISIFVTVIGIANALLMSVTERFKEIGTMKCLGALSSFIRRLFLIESAMIGFAGSVIGTAIGALLPMLAYGFTFGFGIVLGNVNYAAVVGGAGFCVMMGTIMAMLAAIYPANFAARMVPATALRTNI